MSETETTAERVRREFAEALETADERDQLRESNSDLLAALNEAYKAINPTDRMWLSMHEWDRRLKATSAAILQVIRKAEGETDE